MRAEVRKAWPERGLASPLLIARWIHGELNIMVLVVQSWGDACWVAMPDGGWECPPASFCDCPVVITVHVSKVSFSVIPGHVITNDLCALIVFTTQDCLKPDLDHPWLP